jgi:hypothetical protein
MASGPEAKRLHKGLMEEILKFDKLIQIINSMGFRWCYMLKSF